jgi:hypothetical protein
MTPSTPPTRARKLRGNWHPVSEPSVVREGTLEIDADGSSLLDINGTFFGVDDIPTEDQIFFGRAHDGAKVTLIQTGFRRQDAPWFNDGDSTVTPPPIQTELWEPWTVAVGAQLPDGEETRVVSLTFRSPMLTAWAGWLAPRFERARGDRLIGGTASLPDELVADIGFAEIKFRWAVRTRSHEIDLYPEIVVDYREPTTIEASWGSTVVPLLQMFTFFVGVGDSVRLLRYRAEGADPDAIIHGTDSYGWGFWSGDFEIVNASWMAKDRGREAPFRGAQLLSGPDAKDTFGTLIPAWFELQKRLSGPMLDYFSIQMFGSMTVDEAFYRATRSLEVTHGILDPSPKIPPAEWKVSRNAIKAALAEDPHRDFLLTRTKYLDAPSLRERLLALFGLVGPRLRSYAPESVEAFVSKVVKTRDIMTHSGEEAPLSGSDLHVAQVVLDLLMREVLLVQLGFTPVDADEMALRTDRARLLLYPVR